MAPQVSLADDLAEVSRCVAQLFRLLVKPAAAEVEGPATAAGMSVPAAMSFLNGFDQLPPRQGIRFANGLLEQSRQRQASFNSSMRQPHAGSDLMRGIPEASIEAVTASRDQLRKDFPSWRIDLPDGHENLGTGGKVKLVWKASHPDWPDCFGGAAHELRTKVGNVERGWAEDARKMRDFNSGRGVRGKAVR